jgi:hypothetical protein
MPKLQWTELETLKHSVDKVINFHAQNILREKILLDSLKELRDEIEEIILEQED